MMSTDLNSAPESVNSQYKNTSITFKNFYPDLHVGLYRIWAYLSLLCCSLGSRMLEWWKTQEIPAWLVFTDEGTSHNKSHTSKA